MIQNELRSVHRRLSPAFEQFMDYVCANLDQVTPFDRTKLPPKAFPYPMNAWPFLVDASFRQEVISATETVMRLIRLIPERLFSDDLGACGTFFDYPDPELAKLFFSLPNGMETVMARPDFLLTESGFKCLETNVSPNIGGWFTYLWMEAYLERPFFKTYLDAHGLQPEYVNPMQEFFGFLLDLSLKTNLIQDGQLCVAVVPQFQESMPPQVAASLQFMADQYVSTHRPGHKLQFLLPESYDEVVIENGGAFVGGVQVAIIIEADEGLTPGHVLDLFKNGGVVLLNGPTHFMMTNKRALALLSQNAESDKFTAEERGWIERYIPWSRDLKAGNVLFRGEREDLVSLVKAKREQFVLKAGLGCQGEEVLIGNKTEPAQWEAAVDLALAEGGWLVQEFLKSVATLGMGEDGVLCSYDLIWGFFSFGERFSGSFLRLEKSDFGKGVINSAAGAHETLMLFV